MLSCVLKAAISPNADDRYAAAQWLQQWIAKGYFKGASAKSENATSQWANRIVKVLLNLVQDPLPRNAAVAREAIKPYMRNYAALVSDGHVQL
jgi:hypothetical protein